MEMKVVKMEDIFLVTVNEVQFMVKVIPQGFESMAIRSGEPVRKNKITAFEEELLELTHEKLVELIVNEVGSENTEELVSFLDDVFNYNDLESVVKAGQSAHKWTH